MSIRVRRKIMDAEMTEIKERLTVLEGAQAHLFQQNRACYENFLVEMKAVKRVKVIAILIVVDIIIRLWQWQ